MVNRRLVRSRTEGKIAGVCAGLAGYLDVDVVLVRAAWVVFSIVPGAIIGGVLAYIAAWLAVPKVAEEIRLHVPFREEFLIAAKAGLAGGKEFFVHLRVIEAGHRTAVQTERPRGHDEVCALEA